MADNTDLNSFKNGGQWDIPGSTNAGLWEAQRGYQLSPQQSDETAASYAARMDAYNNAQKE
jgi:hypothetical protein